MPGLHENSNPLVVWFYAKKNTCIIAIRGFSAAVIQRQRNYCGLDVSDYRCNNYETTLQQIFTEWRLKKSTLTSLLNRGLIRQQLPLF